MNINVSEALPGATQEMAKSLGISEKELFKLMEQGKLMAAEVLPKFAEQMKKSANTNGAFVAASQKTRAELNRFQTEMSLMADDIYTGGFGRGLAHMFRSLTELTESLREFSGVLGQGLRSAIATVMLPIRILALTIKEVSSWFGESTKEASQFAASIAGITVAILGMVAAVRKLSMLTGMLKTVAGGGSSGASGGGFGASAAKGLLGRASIIGTLGTAGYHVYDYLTETLPRGLQTGGKEMEFIRAGGLSQGINVNLKLNEGPLKGFVTAELENHDANLKAGILAEGGR